MKSSLLLHNELGEKKEWICSMAEQSWKREIAVSNRVIGKGDDHQHFPNQCTNCLPRSSKISSIC